MTDTVDRVAAAIGAAMHKNPLSLETRRHLARVAIEAMDGPVAAAREQAKIRGATQFDGPSSKAAKDAKRREQSRLP